MPPSLRIMVLAGGPDRERAVSLASGGQVAAALRQAGHHVIERDLRPEDAAALDEFQIWGGDVVFPVFHGRWGEGGGAQRLMEQRGLAFVGCRSEAATLCFDKARTKARLLEAGLPTPDYELVEAGERPRLKPPLVLKPNDEGSSIDLAICRDGPSLERAWAELSQRNDRLLVESLVVGREATVGVVAGRDGLRALPPIHIQPATEFYDYHAKYERHDTGYCFDFAPPEVLAGLQGLATATFEALGVRHLCRVDVFLDASQKPTIIELNTMPGFSSHSLLPMAARRAGLEMPALMDQLARLALAQAAT